MRLLILFTCWVGCFTAYAEESAVLKPESPVTRAIGVGETHVYDVPASGVVVVTPTYGNLAIIYGKTVDASDEPPGVEWLFLDNSTTLFVHQVDAHPGAHYTIEHRAYQPESFDDPILTTLKAAELNPDDSNARRQAIALYQTAVGYDYWSPQLHGLKLHTLIRIADLYRRESDFNEARNRLLEAYAMDSSTAMRPWLLIQIGSMFDLEGDDANAREWFCRALAELGSTDCQFETVNQSSLNTPIWASDALNRIGNVFYNKGEFLIAERWYDLALKIAPSSAMRQRAIIAHNFGMIGYHRGDFEQALSGFTDSLNLYRSIADDHATAFELRAVAAAYQLTGNHDDTIAALKESLDLNKEENWSFGESRVLDQIGWSYLDLGELANAEQYALRSRQLKEEKELAGLAGSDVQLGHIRRRQGDMKGALALHRSALSHYQSNGEKVREIAVILELMQDLLASGDPEPALELSEPGIILAKELEGRRNLGRMLQLQGVALRMLQREQQAFGQFHLALESHRASLDQVGEIQSLYQLSLTHVALGDIDAAIANLQEAESLLEKSRLGVSNPTLRASFTGEHMDVYATHVDLLMQRGDVREALELALNSRTRSLVETVLYQTNVTESDSLTQKANLLKKQLAAKSTTMARLANSSGGSEELERLKREAADITLELNSLESQLMLGQIGLVPTLTVFDLQAQLDDETLLAVHFVGQKNGWVWFLTTEGITYKRLPPARELAERIRRSITALRTATRLPVPEASSLSSLLFGESLIGVERLFVAPDGITSLLPYGALVAQDTGVDQITIVPAVAMLDREQSSRANRGVVVLADPVFDAGDARADSDENAAGFERLPGTAREARKITALLSSARYDVENLIGFEANKEALMSANLERAGILHLATHGLVDHAHPELSGLLLAGVSPEGVERPAMLTLPEIYDLNLSADVVVLSACDTALGREISGEGPISLARAFVIGGADQVVASLWKVSDNATQKLMEEFYTAWTNGRTAAEALREAQKLMASNRRWSKPSYWSAFVVVGT